MKKYSGSIIDIHSHILPNVDDGSHSWDNSLETLKKFSEIGVSDIILTPHFRGEYRKTPQELQMVFNDFKCEVKQAGLNINCFLGQEVNVGNNIKNDINDGRVLTLNNSKFILLEFDFNIQAEIEETVYEFITMGYKPIVAHLERYIYADLDMAEEIKSLGGFIQINASSLFVKNQGDCKKRALKFLKNDVVDFVASDIHSFRKIYLRDACDFISKKFGEEKAEELFYSNAKKILYND